MSIIVIAEDATRREILSAGLELSGYHNIVITINMLILPRLDQNREAFSYSNFEINNLVEEYYSDRKPVAENAKLALSFEASRESTSVYASRDLVEQVLSIFLTNAINYTPSGGHISLTTNMVKIHNEQWVQINVKDTGKGIPETEQEYLFTRFFRGKTGIESKKSGTGLGLAIAKEIVDPHQGRITVDSEGTSGKGTTFSLWLPLAPASSPVST